MSDSGINDVLNETNGSNNNNEKKRFSNASLYLKSLCIALLILFFLSLLVLVIRIGDFLPNYTDIIFIEPKEPSLEITDDKKVWQGETEIEIFSISHTNEDNIITVMSGSGDSVVAPGMEGFYKFSFNNVGNMAIDYDCDIKVYFTGLSDDFDSSILPFRVKLKDYNGKYVIGGEDEWAPISELADYTDEQTIGKNAYIYYVLEWSWPFESGNDEFDTYLGNHTLSNPLNLVVEIDAYAVQSLNYEGGGGIPFDTEDPRTGGDIVPVPYVILNVIVFLILAFLIYHELKKNKENTGKLFAGAGDVLNSLPEANIGNEVNNEVNDDVSVDIDVNQAPLFNEISADVKGEPFISVKPGVGFEAADVAKAELNVESEVKSEEEAPKKEVKPRAPRAKASTAKKTASKPKADGEIKVDAPKKRVSKPKVEGEIKADAPKKRVSKPKTEVKADAPKKRVSKPKVEAPIVVPELVNTPAVEEKKNKKVVYTKTKTIKSKNKLNNQNNVSKANDFVSRPLSNVSTSSKNKGRQLRIKQRNTRKGNN